MRTKCLDVKTREESLDPYKIVRAPIVMLSSYKATLFYWLTLLLDVMCLYISTSINTHLITNFFQKNQAICSNHNTNVPL